MGLTLPNPTSPANGQSLDATPIFQNQAAIVSAIQSFDGSQIQSGTVVAGAMNASINPNTLLHDTISSFVQSGCIWSQTSGLIGTMTGGVIYAGTSSAVFRVTVAGVGSNTFTASQDTYVDIDYNGNVAYPAVSNGSTAPTLTVNSIRVAKIITNGSAITSIVQSGSDGIGNIIYPIGDTSTGMIQNPYKFRAIQTASFNFTNSFTILKFDTKVYDTSVSYSTSTGLFTAPIAGFYHFDAYVHTSQASGGHRVVLEVVKNGSTVIGLGSDGSGVGGALFFNGSQYSDTLTLAASDTIQVNILADTTIAGDVSNAQINRFSGFLVSAS